MAASVFLVWHARDIDEEEALKVLGVYATETDAQRRIDHALGEPGFRDYPDQFQIAEYEVGEDHWVGGFRTLGPGEA